MSSEPILPCPCFPWVLALTGKQFNCLHIVHDEAELLQRLMVEDLLQLRLLGIGTSSDHNNVIVERADAARHLLSKVARGVGIEIDGHLDLRHGQFEFVLHFHSPGEHRHKLWGSDGPLGKTNLRGDDAKH